METESSNFKNQLRLKPNHENNVLGTSMYITMYAVNNAEKLHYSLYIGCTLVGNRSQKPIIHNKPGTRLEAKKEAPTPQLPYVPEENPEGFKIKLRALLVALLGLSMSACAFASQPVELELEDDDVAQKLNNVSFARRITKPTIRLVMGYGKLSAFVTAATSLLLLMAVMSKQSWWRRGARWLAAPALLVAALEAASDASDAMLAAALRGSADPARMIGQTAAAALLVTAEILVWYFIAKFFEYNPPPTQEEREKENVPNNNPGKLNQ